MISRPRITAMVALISACCPPVCGVAFAQLEELVNNSPFAGPSTSDESDPALELRSVVLEGAELHLSLYDTNSLVSTWVRLGESGASVTVCDYDYARDVATIEYRGRRMALPLKRSSVAPPSSVLAVVAEQPKVMPPGEAVRLSLVAEEVRWRREVRLRADRDSRGAASLN